MLKGSKNPAGMQKFIDFMQGEDFQAALPDNMYVYPVDTAVALPASWAKYAPVSPKPYTLAADDIAAGPQRRGCASGGTSPPGDRLVTGRATGRGRLGTAALAAVPLAALALFFLYPVLGMVARGFWPDGTFDPGAVLEVLGRPRVHRVLWFTLWSAASATAVAVVAGLPVAFVLHRLRFPGRGLLRALVVVPFVLPTVVVGVAFRQLIAPSGPLGGLGLDGTAVAIIAALVFFNISVVVRTVGAFWEAIDPRREEAAAALGASPLQVLRTVTLPALLPGIVSAASVVFLFCATAFGVVLTMGGLRYANIETEIYLLTTQELDLTGAAALSVLQVLVVTGLLALTARVRRSAGAVARSARRLPRPRSGAPARARLDRGRGRLPDGAARLAGAGLAAPRGQLGPGELPRPDHHGHPQRAAGPGDRGAGQLAGDRAGRQRAGALAGLDRGVPGLAPRGRAARPGSSTACSCCRSASRR